jgi:Transposase DDE domain group 1
MASQARLPFELDQRAETGFITAHGGVPLLLEAFRTSGAAAIRALPESAWQPEREDPDAVRAWAEVAYVPSDGIAQKDRPAPPRYLLIRISKRQGRLFADGGEVKHFAIVTNLPDPEDGSGLDLIRFQRGKAGTVEHAHHVLTNELAAEALPSQRFGANAAWFRLNVLLYNLLSAFKRVALPQELHDARPKRPRFVLLNGVGKVVRHARETVLRLVGEGRRRLADAARLALATGPPPILAT